MSRTARARRRPLTLPIALLASLALVGPACGSPAAVTGPPPAATGTLTVSAAASLTGPFTEIIDAFTSAHPGVEVIPTFDSSARLATQIRDGAAVDVFASADDAAMATLTDAGLVAGPPTRFAGNTLAIVVKEGNPRGVQTLGDLATVGTVALCGSDVPCGRYADHILDRAGVTVPGDRITRGQNVKATFTAVAEGDADAGIVYVTDITGGGADAVAIPDDQNAIADYPIAVVKASTNPSAAEAFVAHVTGPSAQQLLREAGFRAPR